jgi:hypothetical protein
MRFVRKAAGAAPGHNRGQRAGLPAGEADVRRGDPCRVNSLQHAATEISAAEPQIDWRITGTGFRRPSLAEDLALLVNFVPGVLPD